MKKTSYLCSGIDEENNFIVDTVLVIASNENLIDQIRKNRKSNVVPIYENAEGVASVIDEFRGRGRRSRRDISSAKGQRERNEGNVSVSLRQQSDTEGDNRLLNHDSEEKGIEDTEEPEDNDEDKERVENTLNSIEYDENKEIRTILDFIRHGETGKRSERNAGESTGDSGQREIAFYGSNESRKRKSVRGISKEEPRVAGSEGRTFFRDDEEDPVGENTLRFSTGRSNDSNADAKGRGSDLSNATQSDPIRTRAELGAAFIFAAKIAEDFENPKLLDENLKKILKRS